MATVGIVNPVRNTNIADKKNKISNGIKAKIEEKTAVAIMRKGGTRWKS